MLRENQVNQNYIPLKAPQLSAQTLRNIVVKNELVRKDGVRVEFQRINNKQIYHNYAHGGAGVALAYGSSVISVKQLYTNNPVDKPMQIALIGSGLIGLLTAVELSKSGHIVTVYADQFPQFGAKELRDKLGSEIDHGLWYPLNYDRSDFLKFEVLSKISYQYYLNCMESRRYQSFKLEDVYEKGTTKEELRKVIPPFLYNSYKNVSVSLGNGIVEDYVHFQTIKVNIPLFMEELRVEAVLRGVKFVDRSFSSSEDVQKLQEEFIFNCTGLSTKKLFDDSEIAAYPGKMVIFENPTGLNYSIGFEHMGRKIKIHCSEETILLSEIGGGSSQQDIKSMIALASSYLQQRSQMNPML